MTMNPSTSPDPDFGRMHRLGLGIERFVADRPAFIGFWVVLIAIKVGLALWHPEPLVADEGCYITMAREIVSHGAYVNSYGKPTAGVVPGYPLMMAGAIVATGHGMTNGTDPRNGFALMLVLNVFFSLAIAWAASELLWLLTGNRPLSTAGMLLLFVYPPFVNFTWHLLTEIPYTAALMLMLLFWEKTRQKPLLIGNWFFLGLFTVTSFSIRPVAFLLTPVFFAWPLIVARLHWRAIAGAAVGTAVVFMLWTPWVWHNYRLFNKFIPLASTSGMAFYTGTLPDWRNWSAAIHGEIARAGLDKPPHTELTASEHFAKLAKENIARDPAGYVKRVVLSSWRFWPMSYAVMSLPKSRGQYMREGNYLAVAIKVGLGVVNVLMIAGMLASFAILIRRRAWWPYLFLIVYFHVMHAMIMPIDRYSLPVVPVVLIMILGAGEAVWKKYAVASASAN